MVLGDETQTQPSLNSIPDLILLASTQRYGKNFFSLYGILALGQWSFGFLTIIPLANNRSGLNTKAHAIANSMNAVPSYCFPKLENVFPSLTMYV